MDKMDKEEIRRKVIKIICAEMDCQESEITLETKFKDDLGADSLNLINMIMALEDEGGGFNLDISDTESERLDTVGKVIEFIAFRLDPTLAVPPFLYGDITIPEVLGSNRPV